MTDQAPGPAGRRLVLVLGGARSGKSAFAQQLAASAGGERVLFVATAGALDAEMRERVRLHRQGRPPAWRTVEAPREVAGRVRAAWRGEAVILLDCLSLLVSTCLLESGRGAPEGRAWAAVRAELQALEALALPVLWVVVSNEVGWGVVPAYPAGRRFRDVLGRANQVLAARADEVWLLVAGLPLRLKPPPTGGPPAGSAPAGPHVS